MFSNAYRSRRQYENWDNQTNLYDVILSELDSIYEYFRNAMKENIKNNEHYELPNWFMKYNQSGVKFDIIEKEEIVNFCMEFGITVEEYMKPTKETMDKIRAAYVNKKEEQEIMFHM